MYQTHSSCVWPHACQHAQTFSIGLLISMALWLRDYKNANWSKSREVKKFGKSLYCLHRVCQLVLTETIKRVTCQSWTRHCLHLKKWSKKWIRWVEKFSVNSLQCDFPWNRGRPTLFQNFKYCFEQSFVLALFTARPLLKIIEKYLPRREWEDISTTGRFYFKENRCRLWNRTCYTNDVNVCITLCGPNYAVYGIMLSKAKFSNLIGSQQ